MEKVTVGFRVLDEHEIAHVAGAGFTPPEVGGGGGLGGMSSGEAAIASLIQGQTFVEQDADGAITSEGIMVEDRDGNGYYDYAEIVIGNTQYIYDPATGAWVEGHIFT